MRDPSVFLGIIQCVEDAKMFLSEYSEDLQKWFLVSTHGSVNDYFNTKEVSCHELSSFLSNELIMESFQEARSIMKYMTLELDQNYAEKISKVLEIHNINYFTPYYFYLGIFEYSAAIRIKIALQQILSQNNFREVLLYQSMKNQWFVKTDILIYFLNEFEKKFRFYLKISKAERVTKNNPLKKIKYGLSNPQLIFHKLKRSFLPQVIKPVLNSSGKNIFLIRSLYDLSFLEDELKRHNLFYFPWEKSFRKITKKEHDEKHNQIISLLTDEQQILEQENDISVLYWLRKNYLDDFCDNLSVIIYNLMRLNKIHKKYGIDLALWGSSPNCYIKGIIVEYLLKAGVYVIGMQHGGNVGIQRLWSDLDVEFLCTHFFSYGFSQDDYRELYPNDWHQIKSIIIPVGSYKEIEKKRKRNNNKYKPIIDILYPIHFTLPVTYGKRAKNDELVGYQLSIIETLEQLHHLQVVVKPIAEHDIMESWSAVDERLKRLKHLKVIEGKRLLTYLRQNTVRAVVMEMPSTVLYETVGEDIELFLMLDFNLPFGNHAFSLLRKRAHCFDKIEDLQQALFQYQEGELPPLRNDEFYHKYVYRENTQECILTTINDILAK